ncbi:MAG TPA: MoxR family ATPase, partial [Candidatus Binatus sp.]|nr:MoxR family ATPase [Candidatus Binatus sp.]
MTNRPVDSPTPVPAVAAPLASAEAIQAAFRERGYIAERSLATVVFLALQLGRPLLLEGEAGVGKTELAKVLAASLGTRLIRLQCYEGLDVNTAVYEWNYPRQMLEIRLLEARGQADRATSHNIFGPEFLIKRPLLGPGRLQVRLERASPPVAVEDAVVDRPIVAAPGEDGRAGGPDHVPIANVDHAEGPGEVDLRREVHGQAS